MRYVSKPSECEAMQWDGNFKAMMQPGFENRAAEAIVAWVNANGGEARYESEDTSPDAERYRHWREGTEPLRRKRYEDALARGLSDHEAREVGWPAREQPPQYPRIAVRTKDGMKYAEPGHYIVMGSVTYEEFGHFASAQRTRRDFYPCDPETFEKRWAPGE